NIIVLHRDYDNKVILIDIDKINALSATDNATQVIIDNWDFSVREDIATVMKKIKMREIQMNKGEDDGLK
uniref:hypothetical protein n=1 Tax=uncultured Eubacterium sp. TaxID=165185 RepID=UPI00259688B9